MKTGVIICFFLFSLNCLSVLSQSEFSVRLRGSSFRNRGTVEVYLRSSTTSQLRWGRLCDVSWGINDAQVVCRQLGYFNATAARHNSYYEREASTIWVNRYHCTGSESSLSECQTTFGSTTSSNCITSDDAGVDCYTGDFSIRLRGSSFSNRGRVEVYSDGRWGTICDDYWGINDAHVVCRQLGYSHATAARYNAYYGRGSGTIFTDPFDCDGSESSLLDCPLTFPALTCDHSEDVGVDCFTEMDYGTNYVSLTSGVYAGISVGAIVFIGIVVGICICVCNACRSKGTRQTQATATTVVTGQSPVATVSYPMTTQPHVVTY